MALEEKDSVDVADVFDAGDSDTGKDEDYIVDELDNNEDSEDEDFNCDEDNEDDSESDPNEIPMSTDKVKLDLQNFIIKNKFYCFFTSHSLQLLFTVKNALLVIS